MPLRLEDLLASFLQNALDISLTHAASLREDEKHAQFLEVERIRGIFYGIDVT